MTINIPPAIFGSAEIYSLVETPITIPTGPAADVDFTNQLAYGPIFGVPRGAYIDLIVHRTENSNILANYWTADSIDASFDGGTTYENVILLHHLDQAGDPQVGIVGWERFYGYVNILSSLNLAQGGLVYLRLVNAISALAHIYLENAYFALRVTNIGYTGH